jgi:transposase
VSHWGWESLLLRTFRYRLNLTARQTRLLNQALAICCELYNAALQERRDAWRTARKSIGLYDQTKELTEIRTIREDVASLPVDREPLRRVDRAFRAFFRRSKAGQKPGYPRFRSRERYNSLALSAPHFRMEGNQLGNAPPLHDAALRGTLARVDCLGHRAGAGKGCRAQGRGHRCRLGELRHAG